MSRYAFTLTFLTLMKMAALTNNFKPIQIANKLLKLRLKVRALIRSNLNPAGLDWSTGNSKLFVIDCLLCNNRFFVGCCSLKYIEWFIKNCFDWEIGNENFFLGAGCTACLIRGYQYHC